MNILGLKKEYLTKDIFGGLTAAVVALPLALAFGVQSGMGAVAGLYGAIALGIFAALFGGTNTQISGPTGPMTVVASAVIAGEVALYGSLEAAIGTIVATFLLAGLFQISFGLTGIGKYIRYMPYPVISGFMSGIGVIIILLQVFPFFGLTSPKEIVDIFLSVGTITHQINYEAVLLSLATIATIYLFPKVTRTIPSALVALIALTLLANILSLDVPIIGDIPKGLPDVHVDTLLMMDWHHPMVMIMPALTLAALGAIDSLLTSVVADNMTKTEHNPNKELIGQGIGNAFAAIIGGLPGAGATMRTVVNINAGGKTKLSGIIHGIVLLIILLGAGAYAKLIPIPILAGILITVGIGIIDYKGIKHLRHVPRSDAIVMIIVLLLTVFVDLLQAVAIGMVLASILFMKQASDNIEKSASGQNLLQADSLQPINCDKAVYVQTFNGPIFFGFAAQFKRLMQTLPQTDIVILDMKSVPHIDQTGLYALEETIQQMHKKSIVVIISGIVKQSEDMLRNINLIPELVPETHLYASVQEVITELEQERIALTPVCDIQKRKILWRY